MAASAVTSVFDTAELLEAILLDVDNKALILLSHCTCKTFQNGIAGSAKLQRKLFFRYEVARPGEAKIERLPLRDRTNSLIMSYTKPSTMTNHPRSPSFHFTWGNKVHDPGFRQLDTDFNGAYQPPSTSSLAQSHQR